MNLPDGNDPFTHTNRRDTNLWSGNNRSNWCGPPWVNSFLAEIAQTIGFTLCVVPNPGMVPVIPDCDGCLRPSGTYSAPKKPRLPLTIR